MWHLDDCSSIEIYTSDQIQQLHLLGIVSSTNVDGDQVSINGQNIAFKDMEVMSQDSMSLYGYTIHSSLHGDCNINRANVTALDNYRIVWPGVKLPRGLDYSNIAASVENGNPFRICCDHVFFLERFESYDSSRVNMPRTILTDKDFTFLTALCTYDGKFIPQPNAILPYTVPRHFNMSSVPISNMVAVRCQVINQNTESTIINIRKQFCDSRLYVQLYHTLITDVLNQHYATSELYSKLVALDRIQKNKRRIMHQHDIINSIDSSSSSSTSSLRNSYLSMSSEMTGNSNNHDFELFSPNTLVVNETHLFDNFNLCLGSNDEITKSTINDMNCENVLYKKSKYDSNSSMAIHHHNSALPNNDTEEYGSDYEFWQSIDFDDFGLSTDQANTSNTKLSGINSFPLLLCDPKSLHLVSQEKSSNNMEM